MSAGIMKWVTEKKKKGMQLLFSPIFFFLNKKGIKLHRLQRILIDISPKNKYKWQISMMLDHISHPRNENQNHNEIPLHTHQDGYNQKDRQGGFPGGSVVKNPPANAGVTCSIPGPRRSHMLQSNEACAPHILQPVCLRARAWQQEKSLQ